MILNVIKNFGETVSTPPVKNQKNNFLEIAVHRVEELFLELLCSKRSTETQSSVFEASDKSSVFYKSKPL